MKVFLPFKPSVLMLVSILLANGALAKESTNRPNVGTPPANGHFGNIQQLFSDGGDFANRSSTPELDAVKGFRPFDAPLTKDNKVGPIGQLPVAPSRTKTTSGATTSFHPFTEPTEGTADQPPPGSTLKDDGHKDRFFNPQLSSHSNTQYRSTSGYVLGKTGKFALRYGPRVLRYIH